MPTLLQRIGGLASNVGTRLGLPEYGISERLGYNPRSSVPAASTYQPPQPQRSVQPMQSTQLQPGALGSSSAYSGGGGGGGYQGGGFNSNSQIQTVNDNARDQQGQADFEFEQALSIIGQQEEAMRQEYGAEEGRQTLEGQKAKTRAGEAKTKQISGLDTELSTGEKTASMGLREARDLFRQTQQQNIAQLSGLGISSSSVAEALAERLGVETARRIGGITGNLDEIRQNVAREKTRVEEVFQSKLTEIEEGTKVAIDQVRAGLANALAGLAAERGRAATSKAQARTDIAIQARNTIQQIQIEAQQRSQAIQAAAQRRQQALAEAEQFMFRPTDFAGIQNAVNNIQSITAQGFNTQPQLNYQSVAGQPFIDVRGQFTPKKELSLEDQLLQQAYAEAGY